MNELFWFFIVALVVTALVYWLLWRPDPFIAGRRVKSFAEAAKEQCAANIKHVLFGGLRLLWQEVFLNYLLVGGIGSGKTTLLKLLAQQFLVEITPGSDNRGLVYGPRGDFLSELAGMGLRCPVVTMQPFDIRAAAWDMAADATTPAIALQIATAVIPQDRGGNALFFSNAATSLVRGVIETLHHTASGKWTLRDVILAFRTLDRLRVVLAQSSAHRHLIDNYFGSPETGWSILATVQAGMGPFEPIAACWSKCRAAVSLEHWVRGKMGYVLYLAQDQANRRALDTMNQLIFGRITQLLLSHPPTNNRHTFMLLDEVREGAFHGLSDLYTRGRAHGVVITAAFQSLDGLKEAYGDHKALELAGQNHQLALLRVTDVPTAEWMSKVVGDVKFWRASRSISKENTTTWSVVTEPALLPSEFMTLPPTNRKDGLSGYFLSPSLGVWNARLNGPELFDRQLKTANPSVPNFIPRPPEDQRLQDWDTADLMRLNLPPEAQGGSSSGPGRSSPPGGNGPQLVGKR